MNFLAGFFSGALVACGLCVIFYSLGWRSAAKTGEPNAEQCLEIIETCTASLKHLETRIFTTGGSGGGIQIVERPETKNLRAAIAREAERLETACNPMKLPNPEVY